MERFTDSPISRGVSESQAGPDRSDTGATEASALLGRATFLRSSLTNLFHDLMDGDDFRGIDAEHNYLFSILRWDYEGSRFQLRHDSGEITSFERRTPLPGSKARAYRNTVLLFLPSGNAATCVQDFDKRGFSADSFEGLRDLTEDDYNEFNELVAEMRAGNRNAYVCTVEAQQPSWVKKVMHRLMTPVGE